MMTGSTPDSNLHFFARISAPALEFQLQWPTMTQSGMDPSPGRSALPVRENTPEKTAPSQALRVLVIDDDVELCQLLTNYLAHDGFQMVAVHDGLEGLERALSGEFALVILDLMLPGISGTEVLSRIRLRSGLPVIMLSARGEDVDRIHGLESGADDYVPKPFNPRELSARIHSVLRRASAAQNPGVAPPPERVLVGDVELDTGSRSVRRASRSVDLTSVEFDLLEAFLKSPGRVIPREELTRMVLGRELGPLDRSIDVHVSNLRRKLGPAGDGGERIKAIRSVGYLYVMPS
jgi:two-component system response regulator CpxR